MSSENIISIDLTDCLFKSDIHRLIKASLNLSDYYGNNLDALWDELSSKGAALRGVNIDFCGDEALPDDLKNYVSAIKGLIKRAKLRA